MRTEAWKNIYERQRDFCGVNALLRGGESARFGQERKAEDEFEATSRRLKQEAELMANDPAHNPYLTLPERQAALMQEQRFEPRFESHMVPEFSSYDRNK